MQSAKKSFRILSTLSAAAVSALAAKAAHGATLSLYYGQDTNYNNSANGIFEGTTFSASGSQNNLQGGVKVLRGTSVASVPITSSGGVDTITLPVGDYLALSIDAVLTGNVNPFGGTSNGQKGITQPTYLGLSELGLAVSSSDATGTLLTPAASVTSPDTTINGLPSYTSLAILNQVMAGQGGAAATPTPTWPSVHGVGEVQPNLPGYDTAPNSSGGFGFPSPSIGASAFVAGGNTGPVAGNTQAGYNQTAQFASQTNTAGYANATEFADNLVFKGLAAGTVTLAPFAVGSSTEYWTAPNPGTTDLCWSFRSVPSRRAIRS
jgi:hypothetical protein